MLQVRDLHAFYGKSHILHGLDLEIGKGEIVALLGRNGSGRSTAAKAIMGVVSVSGSVKFRESELVGLAPHQIARRGLAYVPENRDVFPTLTVQENLYLGIKSTKAANRWSIEEMFRRFPNLAARANVPAGVLSGGEQQILTICRSLMGDPELIIIDEPTEGLAPLLVAQIGELISEISRQGVSVLLIEQKLTIALAISSRVYVLGHGRAVFNDTAAALEENREVRREWLEV